MEEQMVPAHELSKKTLWIAVGALICIVVVLALVFMVVASNRVTPVAPVQTTTGNQQGQAEQPQVAVKQNPFIKTDDLTRIKDDFLQKIHLQKPNVTVTPTPAYHFNYELAPSLKRPQGMANPSTRVLGITTCNLDAAPTNVAIYNTKSHWSTADASTAAKSYGIDSPPYSLPTETSTYQFFFSTPDNSKFFSLYESSGSHVFHQAVSYTGAVLPDAELKKRADAALVAHNLSTGVAYVTNDQVGDQHTYLYKKTLNGIIFVDDLSLEALPTSDSICNVTESQEMGKVEVDLFADGQLAKIVNNNRLITRTTNVDRISLEDSIKAYQENLPIPPIVMPPGGAYTGTVTIDEATILYYDFGKNFPQSALMPVYATSGKITGTNGKVVRVITLFPVATLDQLTSLGITKIDSRAKDATSQKQTTWDLPIPTDIPPKSTKGGTGKCFGNLVDYTIKCSVAGNTICGSFFSAPSTQDTLGICDAGCKSPSGTITADGPGDPCLQFLQSQNIPTDKYHPGFKNYKPLVPQVKPGDSVSCVLNACPC